MAWMKIDLELPDKPEVHAIAGMLNIDPDMVVGKLIRVWQWFDKHTTDGNAFGVTYALPDRISGVTGFGEAMAFVGWLEQQDKNLVMPKFDRHTSESAKARALTAKRVSNHKAKSNASGNADTVSKSVPREEKDKNKEHIAPAKADGFCFKTELLNAGGNADLVADWLKVRAKLKATNTKTAFNLFMGQIAKAGYTVNQALEVCCSRSWKGFDAEWVKDIKPAQQATAPTLTIEEILAKRQAELKAAREAYIAQEAAATVPVMRMAK